MRLSMWLVVGKNFLNFAQMRLLCVKLKVSAWFTFAISKLTTQNRKQTATYEYNQYNKCQQTVEMITTS